MTYFLNKIYKYNDLGESHHHFIPKGSAIVKVHRGLWTTGLRSQQRKLVCGMSFGLWKLIDDKSRRKKFVNTFFNKRWLEVIISIVKF